MACRWTRHSRARRDLWSLLADLPRVVLNTGESDASSDTNKKANWSPAAASRPGCRLRGLHLGHTGPDGTGSSRTCQPATGLRDGLDPPTRGARAAGATRCGPRAATRGAVLDTGAG